jgi:hypothetical protein
MDTVLLEELEVHQVVHKFCALYKTQWFITMFTKGLHWTLPWASSTTSCFLSLRFIIMEPEWRSRYSDWLRAGRRRGRSSSPGTVKNFHSSMSSRLALGSTQSPIQWVPGAFTPGVKRQGREADHSPPNSAEVKKVWIYTPTPPYVFME